MQENDEHQRFLEERARTIVDGLTEGVRREVQRLREMNLVVDFVKDDVASTSHASRHPTTSRASKAGSTRRDGWVAHRFSGGGLERERDSCPPRATRS